MPKVVSAILTSATKKTRRWYLRDKNKGGRPLKFKSVEELEKKINAYFYDENNKPYTICDLCVWLDCDRQTLLNYQEKEEFFDTIKRAKTRIEANIEKGALIGVFNPTFSIFNMKTILVGKINKK